MSIRTLKPTKGTSYFFTITNCKWLLLFEETIFHDKIYGWFDFMKQRGDEIIGYCIMPNHLHCLIWLNEKSLVINEVIGEAKRLMNYSIVSRLKKKNATALLTQLQEAASDYERKVLNIKCLNILLMARNAIRMILYSRSCITCMLILLKQVL